MSFVLFYKGNQSPDLEIECFVKLKASLFDMLSREGKSKENNSKSLRELLNVRAYSTAEIEMMGGPQNLA